MSKFDKVAKDTVKGRAIHAQAGMKPDVLAGAAAATNIAVAGAVVGDVIMGCIHNTAGTLVDVTGEASFTTDGNLQLSTTDTTADQLLLFWMPNSA